MGGALGGEEGWVVVLIQTGMQCWWNNSLYIQ